MSSVAELESAEERVCQRCDGPLESMNFGPVCYYCQWVFANPTLPDARRWIEGIEMERERSRARKALMAELGMPADAQDFYASVTSRGGEWDGYTLEMFGMDARERVWPPPWPYWSLISDRTGMVVMLKQIWYRRVHVPASPLIVEARWHPEREEKISLHGLERLTSNDQLAQALNGVRMLRRLNHKGRPPDRTSLRREEFLVLYEQARASCLADGFPLTDNNLVRYLPISKATLARYRRRWLPRPVTDNS